MPMGIGLGLTFTLAEAAGGKWWPTGSELAFEFDNGRGFNSIDRTKTTPDSILTYTNPSAKMVYGDDGVLGYAPHNLLLQSQTFETASWTKTESTVVANAVVAPDGTTTAEKLVESTTASAVHYVGQANTVVSGTVYTSTVYLKKAERTKARLYYTVSNFTVSILIDVDLTAGTVSAVTVNGTATSNGATITAVGNDWYRVSLAGTIGAQTAAFLRVATLNDAGSVTYTGDGTSGIYVWGAQLNRGSSALTYIPTTSAAVYSLPIDHNPTTFAPLGVLIEEERKNLLTYSNDFTNAIWAMDVQAANVTKTANSTVAPDGTTTATKLTLASAVAPLSAYIGQSGGTGSHTTSVYAKAAEYSYLVLGIGGYGLGLYAIFDLVTGVVSTAPSAGSTTASIQSVGNGWYKCSVVSSNASANIKSLIAPSVANNNSTAGTSGNGIYVWGAQDEAGAFPTSYIPTVASQVTRLADQVSILTSAFGYNLVEGSVSLSVRGLGDKSARHIVNIWESSLSSIELYLNGTTAISLFAMNAAMNSILGSRNGVLDKVAFAYKLNDYAGSLNGAAVVVDTSVGVPAAPTKMQIGSYGGGLSTTYINGHIPRLTYFPTRRTDADLQVLTT